MGPSNEEKNALPIHAGACVYSSFLQTGKTIHHALRQGRGVYLYLVEGGPVRVNDAFLPTLGAAEIVQEKDLAITAENDAELLLAEVQLS